MKTKGLETVIEELKQRMVVDSAKVRTYEQRIEQFRQNRTFDFDLKNMYKEFNGGGVRPNDVPKGEERGRSWSDILSVRKWHN